MDDDSGTEAPSELEMMLRRNLTLCRCHHTFLSHEVTMGDDFPCSECKCPEFRELMIS